MRGADAAFKSVPVAGRRRPGCFCSNSSEQALCPCRRVFFREPVSTSRENALDWHYARKTHFQLRNRCRETASRVRTFFDRWPRPDGAKAGSRPVSGSDPDRPSRRHHAARAGNAGRRRHRRLRDTRITRRLTERYAIAAELKPYHEHNAALARQKSLERLGAGRHSDWSRTPTRLISDPGFKLVREVCAAGHPGDRGTRTVIGTGSAFGRGAADRPVLLRRLLAGQGACAARGSPSSPGSTRRW